MALQSSAPATSSTLAVAADITIRDWFAASATDADISHYVPRTLADLAALLISLEWATEGLSKEEVMRTYDETDTRRLRAWARFQFADDMIAARGV